MLNWDRVEEMRGDVGAEDFAEIAGLFLAELDEVIETLAALTDASALRDAYHSLKGSALNLGFADLAALCAEAEQNPATADLARIRAACDAGRTELIGRYPEVAA